VSVIEYAVEKSDNKTGVKIDQDQVRWQKRVFVLKNYHSLNNIKVKISFAKLYFGKVDLTLTFYADVSDVRYWTRQFFLYHINQDERKNDKCKFCKLKLIAKADF
jgi:hypothetical protein